MDVFKINLRKIDLKTIGKISEFIKKGGVIVCPTDTVYGLICDARNKRAVARIFQIKKRPLNKPMGIFVQNIKIAREFAKVNKKQEKFLKNGKITAVLNAKNQAKIIFPKNIVGLNGKIGIRIPNYKLIKILFKFLAFPLVQTSANISGKPAETKISKILKQFQNQKNQPDLAIDAGNLKASSPSAVIDSTGKKPKILRKS